MIIMHYELCIMNYYLYLCNPNIFLVFFRKCKKNLSGEKNCALCIVVCELFIKFAA